jgi:hypothetical protein
MLLTTNYLDVTVSLNVIEVLAMLIIPALIIQMFKSYKLGKAKREIRQLEQQVQEADFRILELEREIVTIQRCRQASLAER